MPNAMRNVACARDSPFAECPASAVEVEEAARSFRDYYGAYAAGVSRRMSVRSTMDMDKQGAS